MTQLSKGLRKAQCVRKELAKGNDIETARKKCKVKGHK